MAEDEEIAFVPRLLDGTLHLPQVGDAYVRVRVTEPVPAMPMVTVYLVDGTALVVSIRDVVRLDPVDEPDVAPDQEVNA
jgi:hypothetical protein